MRTMASAQTDVHFTKYCRCASPEPNRIFDKGVIVDLSFEALY
jgi:hypothetical protein